MVLEIGEKRLDDRLANIQFKGSGFMSPSAFPVIDSTGTKIEHNCKKDSDRNYNCEKEFVLSHNLSDHTCRPPDFSLLDSIDDRRSTVAVESLDFAKDFHLEMMFSPKALENK
jgi:hypothetical protein